MENARFKKYMELVKNANDGELTVISCGAFNLLSMTDKQIHTLARYLASERGFEILDGKLTPSQPNPHKVVVFGALELTL